MGALLHFEETPEYILIRPRQYLGQDDFGSIAAAIIRDRLGGEYISAGKESHFRVSKGLAERARSEPAIPEFDPQELMHHEWKGKKTGEGEYAKGSLSWGWDFPSEFSEGLIEVLKKGPLVIEGYEFTYDEERNLVHVRKKK